MEILTTDNRLLFVTQIGKPDCEAGSNTIACQDKQGRRVTITWADVALTFGSYSFPPVNKQRLKTI